VDIPVLTIHPPDSTESSLPVLLDNSNKLQRPNGAEYGTLSQRSARIIHALVGAGCAMQLFCQNRQSSTRVDINHGRTEGDTAVTLCVILDGLGSMAEEVGNWLADYHFYLQDPIHCDRNVLYRNPHLLRGNDENDEPVMTFSLKLHSPMIHAETIIAAPNLFEILNQEHDLLETEQPQTVSTPLHRSAYSHLFLELTENE
jgi:hypothetical protein